MTLLVPPAREALSHLFGSSGVTDELCLLSANALYHSQFWKLKYSSSKSGIPALKKRRLDVPSPPTHLWNIILNQFDLFHDNGQSAYDLQSNTACHKQLVGL